jgi:hypothetical protein
MKSITLLPAVLLAAAVSGMPALAQDKVNPAPAQATVTMSAVPAEAQSVAEPAVINHVVYLARLPAPAELMKGAEAQATPIIRMDQTADQIVVVYQYAGGRTVTFAYTLLASTASASAPLATSTATYTMVSAPPPTATVVYAEPQTVYYTPRYGRYYDPAWDFWAPLAIGVGLGWGFGGHGGWYGGHGGGHGGHGGGHH